MQDKSVLDCGAIQKNPKRCKNLTERRRQRARITPWQTSSTDGVAEKYSSCVRAPFSEVLILAPADARALPPPGHAGVRVQPRSSCRACQNGRRGPRIIRRSARNARARSRAAAATIWPPVPSPSVRFAEAPTRLTCLETAADQKRRRPRNQLPALACAQWRARKQPHRSRLLRALVREQLIG